MHPFFTMCRRADRRGPTTVAGANACGRIHRMAASRDAADIIDRLVASGRALTGNTSMNEHDDHRGDWRGDHHGGRRGGRHRGQIDDAAPWEERGGRGHRMARLFAHGDLHLVVLHLIAAKPRHGYELIKSIEEAAGGAYSPSPGTIYPALSLLEEQGWIEVADTEGARKLYAATAAGHAHLAANRSTVDMMVARMAAAGAARADVPAPILRAMENVKLALRLKVGRGAISPENARAIADILDRAVTEIERI